jgi:hypothetical protein
LIPDLFDSAASVRLWRGERQTRTSLLDIRLICEPMNCCAILCRVDQSRGLNVGRGHASSLSAAPGSREVTCRIFHASPGHEKEKALLLVAFLFGTGSHWLCAGAKLPELVLPVESAPLAGSPCISPQRTSRRSSGSPGTTSLPRSCRLIRTRFTAAKGPWPGSSPVLVIPFH